MSWKNGKVHTSARYSQRRGHYSLENHILVIFCLCHYYKPKYCSPWAFWTCFLVSWLFATLAAQLQKATVATSAPIWKARGHPHHQLLHRTSITSKHSKARKTYFSLFKDNTAKLPRSLLILYCSPCWCYPGSLISCNLSFGYPL